MEYYQVATKEQFDVYELDLSNARQLSDGRYIRHLEYSNGQMKFMWSDANMQPITREELDLILVNEPQEEV